MLSDLIDPKHIRLFIQALYNLEGWDIKYEGFYVSPSGIVPSPTNDTDLGNCCGELRCLEDWIIERVETKNIVYSSSLFTSSSAHRTRRRPLSSLYLISRTSEDEASVRKRKGAKRRRTNPPARPWDRHLLSYIQERNEKRFSESFRYLPTKKDVERILLGVATYQLTLLQSRK
jgi:hypothetical protein